MPRACRCGRGSRLAPPRARGNPLCVCARHTPRRTLRGVQLVGQGPGAWWHRQVRCVSLEVLHERCAVHGAARCGWTLRRPRPARQKGRASGRRTRVWGNRRVGFLRCTAAGAGWRSVCSSCCTAATRVPVPLGRGVCGCKRASSARIPKGHGRWGAGGSGGGGPLAKGATPHLRGAASWRPGRGEERGKDTFFFEKHRF